jgi:hypothetical protein
LLQMEGFCWLDQLWSTSKGLWPVTNGIKFIIRSDNLFLVILFIGYGLYNFLLLACEINCAICTWTRADIVHSPLLPVTNCFGSTVLGEWCHSFVHILCTSQVFLSYSWIVNQH